MARSFFKDKVAVITGGSRGLGLEIARQICAGRGKVGRELLHGQRLKRSGELAVIVPAELTGEVIAGPLANADGPSGVLVLVATHSRSFRQEQGTRAGRAARAAGPMSRGEEGPGPRAARAGSPNPFAGSAPVSRRGRG